MKNKEEIHLSIFSLVPLKPVNGVSQENLATN